MSTKYRNCCYYCILINRILNQIYALYFALVILNKEREWQLFPVERKKRFISPSQFHSYCLMDQEKKKSYVRIGHKNQA